MAQKLKLLRGHALIESAVSSNRIEGINIDQSQINTFILEKPLLKGRGPGAIWRKRGNQEGSKAYGNRGTAYI